MWVGKPWKHSGGRWSAEQIKLATNVQLMRIHLHLLQKTGTTQELNTLFKPITLKHALGYCHY